MFDADDEHLLASFAASAAIAIATAQSVAGGAAAAFDCRGRGGAQALGARAARRDAPGARRAQAVARVRAAWQPARRDGGRPYKRRWSGSSSRSRALQNLITDLRPAALDELGIRPAVEALVARTTATSGLDVEARIDLAYDSGRAPTRLTGEIESTVYRLVQEALTNAVKHAGAERAWVEIVEDGSTVIVAVSDDGSGFDPERTEGGFGLVGMRERVELVDGRLVIDSARGSGTVVRAELPAAYGRDAHAAGAEAG